jgi:hypothetical protein
MTDNRGFRSLLNIDSNAKTVKGQAKGYMTAILYLAPHKIANGKDDLCPYSTIGCRAGCLYTAGRGGMTMVQQSRINKTLYFLENKLQFMWDLEQEITKFVKKAEKKGLIPVVRLNGTSDIDWNFYYHPDYDWEKKTTIFQRFPNVQFYDYTKDYRKAKRNNIPNYHLTYSYSENSPKDLCYDLLHEYGINVAVVMDSKSYQHTVESNGGAIDGDEHDLRFLDAKGKIVALKAKGKARKDKHGFVWKGVL